MNFAEIENTWRSPHNRLNPAELEKNKMQLIAELRRRRRATIGLLGVTFLPLAFVTGRLVLHLLHAEAGRDPVDLATEWGVVPFFLLPWIGWLSMVALYRRHRARHLNYDQSIRASVQALLDENRTERTRCKVIGGLLIASVAALPIVIQQLRAVGKAGDEILVPAYVIYPGYVILMVGWTIWHYRRKLLPRERELEELLNVYR
jgi:hypothetical protein